jgi:molybdopterin-containing oxidoreductase family molybdopterin binding subunit
VGGKVVEAKGDPNAPNSLGRICAKGLARPLDLYTTKRVLRPMKRTNPVKGLGEDPRWQEISWDEALDTIVARLDRIRKDDPRKLIISHFDIPGYKISTAFARAFGTNNFHWNRACYCGSASHPVWLITNGTLNSEVDFERCRYIILWGTQLGHMVNTIALSASSELATARREGAKLVVVDPFCSVAASKADEWVPVKPGTDGALALAMLHVLVSELGIFDAAFIRDRTNGPYLIGPDGRYVRDPASRKPLIMDLSDRVAKPFDAAGLAQPAIEGEYTVGGTQCKPSFQLLKDHIAAIDLEEMARVCTIPLAQIRRITRDFGEAASIGATIDIGGHTLPLRPAGIDYKRGAAAHRGGFNSCWAIHLLNMLVGAVDVPGGQRGVNPLGPTWQPGVSDDGLIIPSDIITKYNKPYPGSTVAVPTTLDLHELFPASLFTRGLYPWGIDEPEKFGITYRPEAMIHGRTNLMLNSHDGRAMAETLKKIDFQVSIGLVADETTELADIMLPDAHDFERWDMFPVNDPYAFVAPGMGSWYWLMRQAVVEPAGEAKPWTEIYIEIARRLGILEDLYEVGNTLFGLGAQHKLEKGRDYSVREIAERQAKTMFGESWSFDRIKETSAAITRDKTLEEAFPKAFLKSRAPIYLEYLLDHKDKVAATVDKLGLEWDLLPYSPVPLWIPCEAHEPDAEYDLIATNSKLPTHQFSITSENLWIDEIASKNPYSYNIMVHTSTAQKRGLVTGDTVCVQSRYGEYRGQLKVTELVHPETVMCCGSFGHRARGMPISQKKGVSHNELLPPPCLKRIDTLSGQIDMCVAVKISKA